MTTAAPLKVFIVYAHEDKPVRDKLLRQLRPLADKGEIDLWSDHEIQAGTVWDEEIRQRLSASDLILMLVSDDFFASDYIRNFELREALARQGRGEVRLLPIIVRHCGWEDVPAIASLQVLPTAGRPVVSREWDSPDEPYREIFQGVKAALREMRGPDQAAPAPVYRPAAEEVRAHPIPPAPISPPPPRASSRVLILATALLVLVALGVWGGLKMMKNAKRTGKQQPENELTSVPPKAVAPNTAISPNSGVQPGGKMGTERSTSAEEAAWYTATRENIIGSYLTYTRNYPNGAHYTQAKETLNRLQVEFDDAIKMAEQLLNQGRTARAKIYFEKAQRLAPAHPKVATLAKRF